MKLLFIFLFTIWGEGLLLIIAKKLINDPLEELMIKEIQNEINKKK